MAMGLFLFSQFIPEIPTLFSVVKSSTPYLAFLTFLSSFVALASFGFRGTHPQPHGVFLSVIFITSFL